MTPNRRDFRPLPNVETDGKVLPLRPYALTYDKLRPCTACHWVRRSLADRLVGQGDYATCAHPDVAAASANDGPATRCVTHRDYLQACGPAGRHFTRRDGA